MGRVVDRDGCARGLGKIKREDEGSRAALPFWIADVGCRKVQNRSSIIVRDRLCRRRSAEGRTIGIRQDDIEGFIALIGRIAIHIDRDRLRGLTRIEGQRAIGCRVVVIRSGGCSILGRVVDRHWQT